MNIGNLFLVVMVAGPIGAAILSFFVIVGTSSFFSHDYDRARKGGR